MHLIQKSENDAHPFIVHTQVVLKFPDQLGPRQIHFRKHALGRRLQGEQSLLFNPDLQGFLVELGTIEKIQLADDHGSISFRGS